MRMQDIDITDNRHTWILLNSLLSFQLNGPLLRRAKEKISKARLLLISFEISPLRLNFR